MFKADNLNNAQLSSNISRYFVYLAFKGFSSGLIAAFWLIYLQQRRGFNLTEATIIDVSFFVASTLGEVPTGVVADTYGRKTSLTVGAIVMSTSIVAWAFAPTMLLIILAYVGVAIGNTFLTGADEALFYETLQRIGRGEDYPRLVGRSSATFVIAMALGSLASGLLGTVDLMLPFLIAGLSLFLMLGAVLTLKEPPHGGNSEQAERKSYGKTLRQAVALMYTQPTLRYTILYATVLPVVAIIMETFFAQPQSLALGVPIVAVGIIIMLIQFMGILGSTLAYQISRRLGEKHILYFFPGLIIASLLLLATFQILPALLFIGVISFLSAVLGPLLTNRIQSQVSDDLRATVLSLQSLMLTILLAVGEPILGFTADRGGFPAAYLAFSAGLGLLVGLILWKGRQYLGQSAALK